jgi:hypothetical protein
MVCGVPSLAPQNNNNNKNIERDTGEKLSPWYFLKNINALS